MSILESTRGFTRQGMEQADITWKLALLRAGNWTRQHSDLKYCMILYTWTLILSFDACSNKILLAKNTPQTMKQT